MDNVLLDQALKTIKDEPSITARELAKRLEISQVEASRVILELAEKEKIEIQIDRTLVAA